MSDNYLEHHGIKGQKLGVRHDRKNAGKSHIYKKLSMNEKLMKEKVEKRAKQLKSNHM